MISKNAIENDLHDAMRQKNEIVKNTLKILLASMKMVEIEKGKILDEESILAIIQKEIKMRRESIVEFEKGNRKDLIDHAEAEIETLERYLPTQLSDDEIRSIVDEIIKEANAVAPSDMGKVMKIAIPRLAGKATTDRISLLVKSILAK